MERVFVVSQRGEYSNDVILSVHTSALKAGCWLYDYIRSSFFHHIPIRDEKLCDEIINSIDISCVGDTGKIIFRTNKLSSYWVITEYPVED